MRSEFDSKYWSALDFSDSSTVNNSFAFSKTLKIDIRLITLLSGLSALAESAIQSPVIHTVARGLCFVVCVSQSMTCSR